MGNGAHACLITVTDISEKRNAHAVMRLHPTMRVTFDTGLLEGTDNLKSAVYFLQRAGRLRSHSLHTMYMLTAGGAAAAHTAATCTWPTRKRRPCPAPLHLHRYADTKMVGEEQRGGS
jgi:hypothetical protein